MNEQRRVASNSGRVRSAHAELFNGIGQRSPVAELLLLVQVFGGSGGC